MEKQILIFFFSTFTRVLYYVSLIFSTIHCMKSGNFSGPYFPVFGLNAEIFGVNLRIQSKYRKIKTRKNSVFGHSSRSDCTHNSSHSSSNFNTLILFYNFRTSLWFEHNYKLNKFMKSSNLYSFL